ncbi:MAG: hypothetical protein A2X40_09805 [Elusimicrobia bacterium GWC2_65_9]|nr:MAG: hypothetical protein A2X37_02040 [Elusimicrobia bacterium GWA2_66_18]OGR68408.1 MAG: hypothetical protein A2X40_09805 [Elusimicrobia bacterium GWC2_65_9]
MSAGRGGRPESKETSVKKTLPVESGGQRLDAFLAESLEGYTRSFLQKIIGRGLVTVNGEPRDPDERVREGERVVVDLPQSEIDATQDFESWVLFEDKRLLVLQKPAGLLMHPLGTSWLTNPEAARIQPGATLAALLQLFRPVILKAGTPRCGIVHRLDRQTSGALVVAKDPATYEALVRAFKERLVEKTYRAVVRGVPPGASRVQAPIGRVAGNRRIVVTPMGRNAETSFKVLSKKKAAALVEAKPLTGRTHQIRAHLAYIGHPVMGDPEFDPPAPGKAVPARMMLHAWRLGFAHPAGGRALFVAEPPADFKRFWKSLP